MKKIRTNVVAFLYSFKPIFLWFLVPAIFMYFFVYFTEGDIFSNEKKVFFLITGLISMSVGYFSYIKRTLKQLTENGDKEKRLYQAHISLIAITLLLITAATFYSILLIEIDEIKHGLKVLNPINSLYFSVSVFTTLGFGDFVPVNEAGKIYVSFLALLGTIHFVLFISLMLNVSNYFFQEKYSKTH